MKAKMKTNMTPYVWVASLMLASLSPIAQAKDIVLKTEVSSPVLQAGTQQSTYVKVGLTGFTLDGRIQRSSANVAIVLDKSGSMNGEKMHRAKEAAMLAVDLLNNNDIVSVISYDDTVQVLVPATRATDKTAITSAIERMNADGSTALFAGVSKGAAEVRKFLDKERVNRVILLSDGQANVGPSSPTELGELGASLSKDGITVTTIGLGHGYNEDLMTNLAGYSDGNHAFVENADDLARVFQYELGDVLSVVAQNVTIQIQCADGVKPLRLLGRSGDIAGQTVTTRLNQLYSEQEKYLLLEVEVPEGQANQSRDLVDVKVVYHNMHHQQRSELNDALTVRYSDSNADIQAGLNQAVVAEATKQVANESSKAAVRLRDEGKTEEARSLLEQSADFVRQQASKLLGSSRSELEAYGAEVETEADMMADEQDWTRHRKELKAKQYQLEKQQTYQ